MVKKVLSGNAWLAGLLVAGGGLVALEVWEAIRYVQRLPLNHLGASVAQPLSAVVDPPARIQNGNPQFRGAHYTDAPGKASGSGVWACDGPSTFEWRFGSDEVVYLIEGEVQVSYLGRQFTIRPGETSLFLQGTSAVWHVPKGLLKSYTLHHPPLLVRWWRQGSSPSV